MMKIKRPAERRVAHSAGGDVQRGAALPWASEVNCLTAERILFSGWN